MWESSVSVTLRPKRLSESVRQPQFVVDVRLGANSLLLQLQAAIEERREDGEREEGIQLQWERGLDSLEIRIIEEKEVAMQSPHAISDTLPDSTDAAEEPGRYHAELQDGAGTTVTCST
jgi:hypothetical protein